MNLAVAAGLGVLLTSIVAGLGFLRHPAPPRALEGRRGAVLAADVAYGLAELDARLRPVLRLPRDRRRRAEPGRLVADRLPARLPLLVPRRCGCCASRRWRSRARGRLGGAGHRALDLRDALRRSWSAILWYLEPPDGRERRPAGAVALDLLLLAALYNAVRRSAVTHRAAFVWFVYAFAALALHGRAGDATSSPGALRSLATALARWSATCVAMALGARRRPPAAARDRGAGRRSASRRRCSPRSAWRWPARPARSRPDVLRPLVWIIAAFLVWRLVRPPAGPRRVRHRPASPASSRRGPSPATSPVSSRRPPRPTRPSSWRWTSTASAAGTPRTATAPATPSSRAWPSRLEASPLAGGIWSRLGADRFAWIGIGHDAGRGRHLAEIVCGVAADNVGELGARATFVVLPDDATTAVNAMAAVDEGLAAAKAGRRAGSSPSTAAGSTAWTTPPATPPRSRSGARPSSRSSTDPEHHRHRLPAHRLAGQRPHRGLRGALALPRRARAPAGQVDRRGPRRRPGPRGRGRVRAPRLSPSRDHARRRLPLDQHEPGRGPLPRHGRGAGRRQPRGPGHRDHRARGRARLRPPGRPAWPTTAAAGPRWRSTTPAPGTRPCATSPSSRPTTSRSTARSSRTSTWTTPSGRWCAPW